ncbi:MAG: antibiotic biosynthesis monooxygenase [bacterium]
MILSVIIIKPRTGKFQELLDVLHFVQECTTMKTGCLYSETFIRHGGEEKVLYMEHWESAEHLSRHVLSKHYAYVLTAIELAAEPPVVSIFDVVERKGLELIRTLRGWEAEVGKDAKTKGN